MSPEYFLYRLTLAEAKDYIQGQDRRYRQSWMQTRAICQSNGADPDGEWLFPWEEDYEPPAPPMTEEEIKAARERMQKLSEQLMKEKPELFKSKKHGSTLADTVQGAE